VTVQVRIPTILRSYTGGAAEVTAMIGRIHARQCTSAR